MKFPVKFPICLLIILFSQLLNGQTMNYQYYNSTTDFPSRRVWTLYQDSEGIMWFGDIEGALSYDGQSYMLYQDRHGLPGAPVLCIDEFEGSLYMGTPNGLAGFKSGKATPLEGIPVSPVRTLYVVPSKHQMWAGAGKGLYRIVKNNGQDQVSSVMTQQDIRALFCFQDDMYVGSYDGKLWKLNPSEDTPQPELILDIESPIRGIYLSGDELFLGTGKGLFKVINGQLVPIPLTKDKEYGISKILVDDKGILWLGTWGNGFASYNPKTQEIQNFTIQTGIPSPFVTDLLLDDEQNLWVSFFYGGVLKWADKSFVLFPTEAQDPVTKLTIDKNDNKWFMSTKHGLMRLDKDASKPVVVIEEIKNQLVYKIFVDRNNQVWILLPEKILCLKGSQTRTYTLPKVDRIGEYRWMYEDQNGHLWFGGTKGLGRLVDDEIVDVTPPGNYRKPFWHCQALADGSLLASSTDRLWHFQDDSLEPFEGVKPFSSEIQSLLELEPNVILVGTSQGLYRYKVGGDLTLYPSTKGFNISNLFRDKNRRTWIGSRNGIWELKDGTALLNVLPEKTMGRIENIIQDSSGTLWFIAHNLNMLFDGKDWSQKRFPPGISIQAFSSIPVDHEGATWFATNRGLLSYHPPNKNLTPRLPQLKSCFLQFDEEKIEVKKGSTIELPLERNSFQVHFNSHSFINEKLNKYEIKVQGPIPLNRKTDDYFQDLMNLSPGTYHVQITSFNGNNQKSEEPFVFKIKIKTPFYRSPLAFLIYVLTLSILVYVIIKISNYRKFYNLEKRNAWLEKELSQKTKDLLEIEKKATASAVTVTISDEISQPLMSIQGNLDLLKQGLSTTQVDDQAIIEKPFSQIQNSIDRIHASITHLHELDGIRFDEYTPGIKMVNLDAKREAKGDVNRKGILFVDDEEELLDVWKTYFESLSFRVFTASDVDHALEILEENSQNIQIVVSDNKMPGKTGYDFFVEVRRRLPDLPFFILTGFDVETPLKERLHRDLQGIIQKPIMLSKLHNIIKPYLENA